MSLTSEDLQALRSEFVTKEDLRTELARYATKEDLQAEIGKHREETAQGFADLRRYMEILLEDQTSKVRVMFDGLAARIDANESRASARLDLHDTRLGGLEGRVTLLETKRPRRR